ncbi:MAG: sialate O-acetylesterase [Myxococcota bacterium]
MRLQLYTALALAGLLAAGCTGESNEDNPEDPGTTETGTADPEDTSTDDTGTDDTGTDLPEPDVQVVLLAGQSNMAGRASAADLPAQLQVSQDDVQLFYSGGGSLIPDILTPLESGSGSDLGPEVTLGRTLADLVPDDDFVLIKHAVGGTSLFEDWDPDTGVEYQELSDTVADGLQALVDQGLTPEVRGFVWLQGEADVVQGRTQEQYTADLTAFVNAVRTDFAGGDDLRFVVGRLSDRQFAGSGFSNGREDIQAAQDEVAGTVANVALVDTDDLTLNDDRHYDTAGQLAMGTLLARALLEQPQASDTAQFDFGLVGQKLDIEEPGFTPLQLKSGGSSDSVLVVDPASGWTIRLDSADPDTNLIGRNRGPLGTPVGSAFTLEAVYIDFVTAIRTFTIGGLDPARTYDVQFWMFDDNTSDLRTQTLTLTDGTELGSTDGPGNEDRELTDDDAFSIVGRALTPEPDGTLTLTCANSVTVDRCLTNGIVITEN